MLVVKTKHAFICRKVTTDCILILPIFVYGLYNNTNLHYCSLHVRAVYSNDKIVYLKGVMSGRMGGVVKEMSQYAIAKLEFHST